MVYPSGEYSGLLADQTLLVSETVTQGPLVELQWNEHFVKPVCKLKHVYIFKHG